MNKEYNFNNKNNLWVNIDMDNNPEIEEIRKKYDLDSEILTYSLDRYERARVEYDVSTETTLMVFHIPHQEKNNYQYKTSPMTFILKEGILLTFSTNSTNYVVEIMENILQKTPNSTPCSFLLSVFFLISDSFFPQIEEIEIEKNKISDRIRKKITKKNLLMLSDLEIGLIYLVTGSKQNCIMLEQIKGQPVYRHLTVQEKEQLDDVLIEAKQVVEMIELTSRILEQLSITYNNLLNNNINDIMKILTVWSLLLTIPTIIIGLLGIGVPLFLDVNSIIGGLKIFVGLGLLAGIAKLLWNKFLER